MGSSFALLRRSRSGSRSIALATLLAAFLLSMAPVSRAATGTITGFTYQDLDRDAVRDPEEAAFTGHQLYLFTAGGSYVTTTLSDATGHYAFDGLTSGDYRVEYASPSWWPIREDWVPTTTGSVYPRIVVHLIGSAVADFGWRRIVRSTNLAAPMSWYTGPSGLRVKSYTDALTAADVHAAAVAGLVGQEAVTIEVRFGYGSTSQTASAAVQDGTGHYTSYSAASYVAYLSWLDGGHQTLAHEYGHAWSGYYAHLVQQDPSLTGYLAARGLAGDPRLGSAYEWDPAEIIAEDYRQLFGSPNAQAGSQMNTEIPPAAAVPGLHDYLQNTFMGSPNPGPTPTPTPTPSPAPAIVVSNLTVQPAPVKNVATIGFTVSLSSSVTISILDAQGTLVRTLASGKGIPAGASSMSWNRKNSAGQRVKAGTYIVSVYAVAGSASSGAQRSFTVA